MKKLLIFLIFVTAAIYSQDKGVINGRVTDKETQNPVPEATVNILNTDYKTKNEMRKVNFLSPAFRMVHTSSRYPAWDMKHSYTPMW